MQTALALIVYLLILTVSLLVLVALPAAFLRRRIAVIAVAAYAAGGAIGWALRPQAWPLPFFETIRATVDAARYGHRVEHQAELIVLFWVMGAGSAAALLCTAIAKAAGPASRPAPTS